MLGLWDGNPVKLDCDDHYTTTDVINSLSNNNKKNQKNKTLRLRIQLTLEQCGFHLGGSTYTQIFFRNKH